MGVLKKPLITEKYTALGEKHNQYGFIVDRKATKAQIKKEVEAVYEVEVSSVNTMIYAGKPKFRYSKRNITEGRTRSFKKAVVTLKKDYSIDFYSNI